MSFGFGFALPAYPLRGGGGNNPFNQLGPTLDLSFTGVVTDLTDPNGYTLNTDFIIPQYQIAAQYVVWETGVGLVDKTFSQIITFTRASTGTYFDSLGVLQSAAIDAPRFDYNPSTLAAQGLLIEEARTNLRTYSEQFDNAAWSKTGSTVTANATTAPTGTVVADKLVEDTSTGGHLCVGDITGAPDNTVYTASCFCKASERNWVAVAVQDKAGALNRVWFNLSTGAQGTTNGTVTAFSAVNVGNGWYRLAVSASSATGASNVQIRISMGTADNTASYTGNGTSGLFLWGAQLEAGAFPTSYIPTTTTALTRSADVASVNTLSPWFNNAAGTLYAQGVLVGGTAAAFPYQASLVGSNVNNDSIGIQWTANTGVMRFGIRSGGAAQADIPGAATKSANSSFKVAGRYATNDAQAAFDGTLGTPDTAVTLPTITALSLGGPVGFQPGASVWLRQMTYYPRAFSNAELQAITT